jgi:hypothetical protein
MITGMMAEKKERKDTYKRSSGILFFRVLRNRENA